MAAAKKAPAKKVAKSSSKATVAKAAAQAVNPGYTDAAVLPRVTAAYRAADPKSVQLQEFFLPPALAVLTKAVRSASWKRIERADRFCRSEAKLAPDAAKLLSSPEVQGFIRSIIGKPLTGTPVLERYTWRDYTLRNDEEKPPGVVSYIDLTAAWPEDAGGEFIVTDPMGEKVRVAPAMNTLVLVDCSKAYPFVHYVNRFAGKAALVRIVWR